MLFQTLHEDLITTGQFGGLSGQLGDSPVQLPGGSLFLEPRRLRIIVLEEILLLGELEFTESLEILAIFFLNFNSTA